MSIIQPWSKPFRVLRHPFCPSKSPLSEPGAGELLESDPRAPVVWAWQCASRVFAGEITAPSIHLPHASSGGALGTTNKPTEMRFYIVFSNSPEVSQSVLDGLGGVNDKLWGVLCRASLNTPYCSLRARQRRYKTRICFVFPSINSYRATSNLFVPLDCSFLLVLGGKQVAL